MNTTVAPKQQGSQKQDDDACQATICACKISVIIPIYNAEKYIKQCLSSWTNQTLQDIEIICVNDASTDNSLNILQKIAHQDTRIHIYSFTENKGCFCARKFGIEKACGTYIMFCDQDDTIQPATACEELYLEITESKVDILHFGTEIIPTKEMTQSDINGCINFTYTEQKLLYEKNCFLDCFRKRKHGWNLWNKIYKTSLCKQAIYDIEKIAFQRLPISDDKVFYFIFSYLAYSYKEIPKKFYQYHIGIGQTGKIIYTLQQFKNFCMMRFSADSIEEFIQSQGTEILYQDVIQKNYTDLLNDCIAHWFLVRDEEKAAAFDMMLQYWKPERVVSRLAELHFYDGTSIARQVQHASSLKYDGHQVKTIATYYHRLANGGVEHVLSELCSLWTAMGYCVLVLTDKEPCTDDYPLPAGVERIVIPDWEEVTPQTYYERAAALRRILHDYHVDAVVYHAWLSPLLFWDELTIKTAGVACLIHCHGIFSLTSLWAADSEAFVAQYRLADAAIALSQTDYAFWKHCNANVHVTINPLSENIEEWIPATYTPNHSILWLARLDPSQKNPMDLIPIMEAVVRAVPDAVLHVVGKSEDGSIEAALQDEIAKRHLEQHIVLEGFHTDVKPWYNAAQVFLMTSAYEGYPMTLTESKLAGLPCVMYELPYLTLCKENRGLLPVPQRDTRAAARAIIKLLTDDELCAQMGRDARAHIEELARFDFKGKWHQIFTSVEQTHEPLVPAADALMMDTLINHQMKGLQKVRETKNAEISSLQQDLSNQQQWTSRLQQNIDNLQQSIARLQQELLVYTNPKGIGAAAKVTAKVLLPNRLKPFLKAVLRRIPQGVKKPIKRLLHW